jgi:hypothetical protein
MRYWVHIVGVAAVSSLLTFGLARQVAIAKAHAVQIVEDGEAGAIRFIIDGQEVARVTSGGLQVKYDVRYGGMSIDTGPEAFDRPVPKAAP